MTFKNPIPKQYWIGVLLGAVVIAPGLLMQEIPFFETPSLMLGLMFPVLGGVVAGFIVKRGIIGGVIAGFLAGMIGGIMRAMLGELLVITGLIQWDYPFTLGQILIGTLEHAFLLATPAIIGGIIGGIARMIPEIIQEWSEEEPEAYKRPSKVDFKGRRMQRAGMILGIAGGIIGLFSAVGGVISFGEIERSLLGAQGIKREISLGWPFFLFSVYRFFPPLIGIVGGVLANSKTTVAGGLCLIAGILGLPYLFSLFAGPPKFFGLADYFGASASPLLIIAGILLLFSTKQARPEVSRR